jgi:hypothetical protein
MESTKNEKTNIFGKNHHNCLWGLSAILTIISIIIARCSKISLVFIDK